MMSLLAKLGSRDRRALMIGAAIVLPLVVHRGAVRPYLTALRETREAVEQERSLLQREITLAARAPALPREIQAARLASNAADRRLFSGMDAIEATSSLSSYVGGALRSSSVTIHQIASRDAEQLSAGLSEVSLDVRAEGSLGAVLRGLRGLESGPRLLRVTRVGVERSLGSSVTGGESLVITATVRGYARLGAEGRGGAP